MDFELKGGTRHSTRPDGEQMEFVVREHAIGAVDGIYVGGSCSAGLAPAQATGRAGLDVGIEVRGKGKEVLLRLDEALCELRAASP